jgi:hypothetical protein
VAGGNQYNDSHITNNTYQNGEQSSDAVAFEVRNASEGATLLAELARADKTLDRARRVFRDVATDVVASALRVLLGRDEHDLVIALLAAVHETKAKALVDALGPDGAEVGQLLVVFEAVTQCENKVHKALGERDGWFQRATSGRGTPGFLRRYANGAIYWTPEHGALATTGEIAQCHGEQGGSAGRLGFPVAPAVSGKHPRTETECTWQLFEGPDDYGPEACGYLEVQCGATVVSSQKYGTYAMWGAVGELAELGWRDRDWMGVPAGKMTGVGPSSRVNEAGTSGWRQRFQAGLIYSSAKAGAFRVPRRWAEYFEGRGGVLGSTGFPVGPALDAAKSPQGTAGWYQRFEGAWDYPDDVINPWAEESCGATIYHSNQHGPHTVERGNGALYERLKGTASWLGFPISDEVEVLEGGTGRTVQHFEGGAIFYAPEYDSLPVRREVLDYLAEGPYRDDLLGFPVRAAEQLASGETSYVQVFERGIVLVRDGLVLAWDDPA